MIFNFFIFKINSKNIIKFEINYFILTLPFRITFFIKIIILNYNILFNFRFNLLIIYLLTFSIIRIFMNFKIIFIKTIKINYKLNLIFIFIFRFIFII
jgi:hypothetical protein